MPEFPSYIQVHVYRLNNGATEHLILRRAPNEKDYPDMMQVVTGAIEQSETADNAALRELQEELGVQPIECHVLPIINSFYHARRHTITHSVVFAARIDLHTEIKLSHEHSEYFWCSPEEAEQKLIMPSHIQSVKILCEYMLNEEKKKYLTRITLP